ncbi:histone-lysine N-methyltransferase SETMAR [Trichonephila clavipes]|nr:histone-lysine N-methyltransferase SETMAR [Trichonephila clavipes]
MKQRDLQKVTWDGILMLDDNARPHSVTVIQDCNVTFGWERLHYPPCSPDLTPDDFHQFPALKKNLAERCSGSNTEVKQPVKCFFRTQILFFLESF